MYLLSNSTVCGELVSGTDEWDVNGNNAVMEEGSCFEKERTGFVMEKATMFHVR